MKARTDLFVIMELSRAEGNKAARLGHLAMNPNLATMAWHLANARDVEVFAEIGLRAALHESYDRAFPSHYPDDCEESDFGPITPLWPRGNGS